MNVVKRNDRKSDCAINFSLENIGDPWSLLIVRDIVFFGKKTFGEFLASDERIGTTTLARRLKELEDKGILAKTPNTEDGRIEEYSLEAKGLDLIPLLLDLTAWGAHHDPKTGANKSWIKLIQKHRVVILRRIRETVKKGHSVSSAYGEIVAGLK